MRPRGLVYIKQFGHRKSLSYRHFMHKVDNEAGINGHVHAVLTKLWRQFSNTVNLTQGSLKYKRTDAPVATNNKAPRWTFTDPCKPDKRPGAREESASPAWLAVPAMNARDTTKGYIWTLNTVCGPTLYRKCHSHNTPGKRHNNT